MSELAIKLVEIVLAFILGWVLRSLVKVVVLMANDKQEMCAKCGGTRGILIHKVSLLDSDPWLEGVEDVHEFDKQEKADE